jgi:hypothetical protein
MNDTVEITTIKVKLGDKDVEMTLDQARKLKIALDALFRVETPYTGIRSTPLSKENLEKYKESLPEKQFPPMQWPLPPKYCDCPNEPWRDKVWCTDTDGQTLRTIIS